MSRSIKILETIFSRGIIYMYIHKNEHIAVLLVDSDSSLPFARYILCAIDFWVIWKWHIYKWVPLAHCHSLPLRLRGFWVLFWSIFVQKYFHDHIFFALMCTKDLILRFLVKAMIYDSLFIYDWVWIRAVKNLENANLNLNILNLNYP